MPRAVSSDREPVMLSAGSSGREPVITVSSGRSAQVETGSGDQLRYRTGYNRQLRAVSSGRDWFWRLAQVETGVLAISSGRDWFWRSAQVETGSGGQLR